MKHSTTTDELLKQAANGIVSIESSADFELYFDESMQEWLCQTLEMAYIANFVIAADNYNKIMNLEV